MANEPTSGFFPFTFKRYRKALGAGLATFLAGFPLVALVDGSETGDPKTLAAQAATGAIAAIFTAVLRNEG